MWSNGVDAMSFTNAMNATQLTKWNNRKDGQGDLVNGVGKHAAYSHNLLKLLSDANTNSEFAGSVLWNKMES